MASTDRGMDGMMGRLHFEMKGIIGFARLAAGDVFEVVIKHGSQKWKSRAKTLPDRTQKWESSSTVLSIRPNLPILVKVLEVKLFKSRTLNERTFDPTKFCSTQAQLVTMNLNATGTIKLQLVVLWLPLLSQPAKMRPPKSASMQQAQQPKTPDSGSPVDQRANSDSMSPRSVKTAERSPPRVRLREKKREGSDAKVSNKQRWRSSTTLLDALYDDLSKSIPTIDDLAVLSTSKKGLHKSAISESHVEPDRNRSTASCGYSFGTRAAHEWIRSTSLTHLANGASVDTSDSANRNLAQLISDAPSPALNQISELLTLIDGLREQLKDHRATEYTELTAFEAAMLNWEAVLKLNKAVLISERRAPHRRSSHAQRLAKRSSLCLQRSPSTTSSDEIDNNVLMKGVAPDQAFENDSGIDSLRQHTSPYNFQTPSDSASPSLMSRGGSGPSQRRFKQFKERRKSLGISNDLSTEFVTLFGGSSRQSDSGACDSKIGDATVSHQTASGHVQVDECLTHHLHHASMTLKAMPVATSPLQYRLTDMLYRMEQDTVALEELLQITDSLPSLPNVANILNELGADADLQEIWLSSCYPLRASLVVPLSALRDHIAITLRPIVSARYPDLVTNVLKTVITQLTSAGDWDSERVSLFQFVALFRAKLFAPFIENLAHEAWIISNLTSTKSHVVRDVMKRLRNVPVVPPIECLRHIGLVLVLDRSEAAAVCQYFRSANITLSNDLAACFICLLEHADAESRRGACRALAMLQNHGAIEPLNFVSREDSSDAVREEARRALERLWPLYKAHNEMTKI